MNANANANNSKTRKTYVFTNNNSAFGKLNFAGVQAFFDVTLDGFKNAYEGTDLAISSIDYRVKTRKDGKRLMQVCIVPANLNSKGIYLTTNTTASIDLNKIGAKYAAQWARLAAKNEAANTPESIAKRETAAKTRKLRASARAYLKSLVKHGIDEATAQNLADDYLLAQYKQFFAAENAAA